MRWTVVTRGAKGEDADLLVAGVPAGERGPDHRELARVAEAARVDLGAARRPGAFTAEPESWFLLPRDGGGWVLLMGLGSAAELSCERLRRIAGVAAAQARRLKAGSLAWLPLGGGVGLEDAAVARCLVEGSELALGAAGSLKTGEGGARGSRARGDRGGPPPLPVTPAADRPRRARLLAARDAAGLRRGAAEGEAYAAGCLLARRLTEMPANYLPPRRLAAEARRLARAEGLRCTVMGEAELRRRGMGGILAVAAGSEQPPAMAVIEGGPRGAPLVALVGKGVTFDAGGISIKPSARLDQMRMDMAGAAAVLGAVLIARRLRLPARLLAVLPLAENMPDGRALKPGDVITIHGGRTVEVINTDAEGRLLLADALGFAARRRPRWLIDIATLTGSCAMALGEQFAGVMGNHGGLIDVLRQAGGETFERVWPLPLIEEHHRAMESQVADLKNLGPREAGALTAAAFLAEFVPEEVPWAHLDIAGPAWAGSGGPLGPKGASGFGARLLARAIQILVS